MFYQQKEVQQESFLGRLVKPRSPLESSFCRLSALCTIIFSSFTLLCFSNHFHHEEFYETGTDFFLLEQSLHLLFSRYVYRLPSFYYILYKKFESSESREKKSCELPGFDYI